MFTSSNPSVLGPLASPGDDRRRDRRSQTEDGLFRARCPGNARIVVASGFEASQRTVRVPSARGRIVRRARVRGRTGTAWLRQPAQIQFRVRRGRRVLRTVRDNCYRADRIHTFRWDGRLARRGRLRRAAPGVYRVELKIRSDRAPVVRSARVRLR